VASAWLLFRRGVLIGDVCVGGGQGIMLALVVSAVGLKQQLLFVVQQQWQRPAWVGGQKNDCCSPSAVTHHAQ